MQGIVKFHESSGLSTNNNPTAYIHHVIQADGPVFGWSYKRSSRLPSLQKEYKQVNKMMNVPVCLVQAM